MDEHGEILPVAKPDADDLERLMLETDSLYDHRRTSDGGIEILAKGRSAITLLVWLEVIVRARGGSVRELMVGAFGHEERASGMWSKA
jgi:hypothetical protein